MKDYNLKINGNDYEVSIGDVSETNAEVIVNGTAFNVELQQLNPAKQKQQKIVQVAPKPDAEPLQKPTVAKPVTESAPASTVKSPLPGVILDIMIKVGDTVKNGQQIMILEAMKMENRIDSNREGVVQSINVSKGDSVLEGDTLITIG